MEPRQTPREPAGSISLPLTLVLASAQIPAVKPRVPPRNEGEGLFPSVFPWGVSEAHGRHPWTSPTPAGSVAEPRRSPRARRRSASSFPLRVTCHRALAASRDAAGRRNVTQEPGFGPGRGVHMAPRPPVPPIPLLPLASRSLTSSSHPESCWSTRWRKRRKRLKASPRRRHRHRTPLGCVHGGRGAAAGPGGSYQGPAGPQRGCARRRRGCRPSAAACLPAPPPPPRLRGGRAGRASPRPPAPFHRVRRWFGPSGGSGRGAVTHRAGGWRR